MQKFIYEHDYISGGGIIHMEIAHTLAVDGYIKANSENTISASTNGASGGSGGSILIQTFNFTGMLLVIKYYKNLTLAAVLTGISSLSQFWVTFYDGNN
jgi:hypothetical protein